MMEKIAMPVPYEDRNIKAVLVDPTDPDRKPAPYKFNTYTWEFMKNRYTVIRNFIPEDVIELTLDTWKAFERTKQYNEIVEHENRDITFKNPESSIGKSRGGYCTPWGISLHQYVWKKLDDYIDLPLRQTYSYSRKYDRGAYLASHLDRPSCEVSATLCLDYRTDDQKPWPIWIRGDDNYAGWGGDEVQAITQKIPNRSREKNNCTKVMLEPGDILLYQGPNAPHWRDYLLGEYSYHIFLHFYNMQTEMRRLSNFYIDDNDVINGKTKKEKPAKYKYSSLELDGRVDRLDPDGDRTEAFDRFINEYEAIKVYEEDPKAAYREIVNNYRNIEKSE